MKNSLRITLGVAVLLFAVTGFCFGQTETFRVDKSTALDFKNESKKAEVKIKMSEEFNDLRISIACVVELGSIEIEIYNPKGEKQGNYSIKSEETITMGDQTTKNSFAQGNIDKNFKDPIEGEWIIKAIPTAATGKVNIRIGQLFRAVVVDPTVKITGDK